MTSKPKVAHEKEKADIVVDLHVYIVPVELWLEKYHKARNTAVLESVSAGFIRVSSSICLHDIRDVITEQLGSELIPERFIFLRSVGRCLAVVNRTQELVMNASDFIHPASQHSELFLLPNNNDNIDISPKKIPDINIHKNSPRNGQFYETTSTSGRSDLGDENNYVHFSNMIPTAPSWNLLTPHRQSNDISDVNTPNFSQFSDGSGSSNDGDTCDDTSDVRTRDTEDDVTSLESDEKTIQLRNVQLNENVEELQVRILERIEKENSRLESDENNVDQLIQVPHNSEDDALNDQNSEVLIGENLQQNDNFEYEFTNVNLNEKIDIQSYRNSQEPESDPNLNVDDEEEVKTSEVQLLGDKGNPAVLKELGLSDRDNKSTEEESIQEEIKEKTPNPVESKTTPSKTSPSKTSPIKSKVSKTKQSKPTLRTKGKGSYSNKSKDKSQDEKENKSKSIESNDSAEKLSINEKEKSIEKKAKAHEIEELKRKIELVRAERKTYEQSLKTYAKKREEMITEMAERQETENNIWKKKFSQEKQRTVELNEQIEKIRKTIEKQFQKSIPIPTSSTKQRTFKIHNGREATIGSGSVGTKKRKESPPSEKSNQRHMVTRLQNEINDLNIRHEIINKQLVEEKTMKTFAAQELKDLRLKSNNKGKIGLNTNGDDNLADSMSLSF